jgi:predicted RNase H-like nuclease (RuvC/YqgF family)
MNSSNIFEVIILFLTNGFTWFMTRRKYQEEVASQEILNLTSTFEFYKTIISDLQDRVSELNKKIDKMEEEMVTLRAENETLKKLKKYENL